MSSLLVSAAQVAANPAWRIFDCRHDLSSSDAGRAAYDTGHLPGALHLHLDHDLAGPMTGRNGRHPLPDWRVVAARMAELGVNTQTQIVSYDDQGGVYAARFWWMLRWIGHDKVAVLDGGIAAWQNAGFTLDTDVPVFGIGNLRPLLAHRNAYLDVDEISANLDSKIFQLLDARNAERFAGHNETLDPVAGHIPGALNRFFKNNLDPASGCFKSSDALRAEFSALLGDVDAHAVVHQCGSGVTACHNLLAMEIAGLNGSRLYPGSWSEWCSDSSRPIVGATVGADSSTP